MYIFWWIVHILLEKILKINTVFIVSLLFHGVIIPEPGEGAMLPSGVQKNMKIIFKVGLAWDPGLQAEVPADLIEMNAQHRTFNIEHRMKKQFKWCNLQCL